LCSVQGIDGCATCKPGHVEQDGNCFAAVANCEFQYEEKCVVCKDGMANAGNKCVTNPAFCETNTPEGCISCKPGYSNTNGNCFAGVKNCDFQYEEKCVNCREGFAVMNNTCVTNLPSAHPPMPPAAPLASQASSSRAATASPPSPTATSSTKKSASCARKASPSRTTYACPSQLLSDRGRRRLPRVPPRSRPHQRALRPLRRGLRHLQHLRVPRLRARLLPHPSRGLCRRQLLRLGEPSHASTSRPRRHRQLQGPERRLLQRVRGRLPPDHHRPVRRLPRGVPVLRRALLRRVQTRLPLPGPPVRRARNRASQAATIGAVLGGVVALTAVIGVVAFAVRSRKQRMHTELPLVQRNEI
ncbi:Cysteine-rich membrane protein 2, partial [Spironucleus salmonicida]